MQYHSTLLLTLSSFFLNGSTFLPKMKFYYYAYNFKKMTEYFPIKSNTKGGIQGSDTRAAGTFLTLP